MTWSDSFNKAHFVFPQPLEISNPLSLNKLRILASHVWGTAELLS